MKSTMTIDQFKAFVPRCVSEDPARRALTQPCRRFGRAYATDGRVALVIDTGDTSFATFEETGARSVPPTLDEHIAKFKSAIASGRCEAFLLDAARLRLAVRAVFQDLEPSMDYLRSHEPDPDDPDDAPETETVRFVRERFSRVILPDGERTVISGNYADILADVLAATGTGCAYIRRDGRPSPVYACGDNWHLILMPLRGVPEYGEPRWSDASAFADAASGALLHSYNSDNPARVDVDALRFPKKGEVAG